METGQKITHLKSTTALVLLAGLGICVLNISFSNIATAEPTATQNSEDCKITDRNCKHKHSFQLFMQSLINRFFGSENSNSSQMSEDKGGMGGGSGAVDNNTPTTDTTTGTTRSEQPAEPAGTSGGSTDTTRGTGGNGGNGANLLSGATEPGQSTGTSGSGSGSGTPGGESGAGTSGAESGSGTPGEKDFTGVRELGFNFAQEAYSFVTNMFGTGGTGGTGTNLPSATTGPAQPTGTSGENTDTTKGTEGIGANILSATTGPAQPTGTSGENTDTTKGTRSTTNENVPTGGTTPAPPPVFITQQFSITAQQLSTTPGASTNPPSNNALNLSTSSTVIINGQLTLVPWTSTAVDGHFATVEILGGGDTQSTKIQGPSKAVSLVSLDFKSANPDTTTDTKTLPEALILQPFVITAFPYSTSPPPTDSNGSGFVRLTLEEQPTTLILDSKESSSTPVRQSKPSKPSPAAKTLEDSTDIVYIDEDSGSREDRNGARDQGKTSPVSTAPPVPAAPPPDDFF